MSNIIKINLIALGKEFNGYKLKNIFINKDKKKIIKDKKFYFLKKSILSKIKKKT